MLSGMAITWYGNQSTADGCNYGVLAVIWPLLQRMQVASIINRHLPADPQAEYDHGRVLTLLMAARLYSPVALVNVPKWAAESGADILWDIPAEKLNDDRLGRSLDAFFTQRHSILASIAPARIGRVWRSLVGIALRSDARHIARGLRKLGVPR